MSFKLKKALFRVTRGDDIVAEGTMEECMAQSKLAKNTLKYYSTPGYLRETEGDNFKYRVERIGFREDMPEAIAIYKGDSFVTLGSPEEVAEELQVPLSAIGKWLESRAQVHGMVAIIIEEDDES